MKSSRIGRQAMEEPNQTNMDKTMTVSWGKIQNKYSPSPSSQSCSFVFFFSSDQISAPFEIGVTLRAEDLADYIVELQEIVQRLLGNTESAGCPFFLVYTVKKVFPLNITIYLYIYILFSPERPSPRWRSETVSVFSIISFSYLSY